MIKGKNILIGISGGIAAYKIPLLVRLFKKNGANVKVIITQNAKKFVTPLTLEILSKNQVDDDIYTSKNGDINYIELNKWADIFWIAPCTASQLSKMATGMSDNIVTLTYLSATCPIFIAPAMDLEMYKHPTTAQNIKIIKSHNVNVLDSEEGFLASGLIGKGRMAEPEQIFNHTLEFLNHQKKQSALYNKNVLITAGPTKEAIDPIRFISNHSSGKMSFALAEMASTLGANVTIVSGLTSLSIEDKSIKVIDVVTANEMYQECENIHEKQDVCLFVAAVTDFLPKHYSNEKIKKENIKPQIQLVKNIDIAKTLGGRKNKNQIHVGFALETNNAVENAKTKLKKKNLDLIILNTYNKNDNVFGSNDNQITIIYPSKPPVNIPKNTKRELAKTIFNDCIIPLIRHTKKIK